jgi:N6-adenosine-specific RNA methylase IME4
MNILAHFMSEEQHNECPLDRLVYIPHGGFRTIVADPPWDVVRSFGGANWANGERDRKDLDYPTMTVNEICALPVGQIVNKDAHLYIWTTGGFLERTFEVGKAWGFKYVSTLVWCKPRGGFVGGAFYPNVEFVLFFRSGKSDAKSKVNTQWWEWPRGKHSTKPEQFQDIVERVSNGPYLEMFARRPRDGWVVWGNEI